MIDRSRILSLSIDHLSFRESLDRILARGLDRQQGFVCFANVHMVIEAHNDAVFRNGLKDAWLVLPDGKPVALASNWLHGKKQERISGMDFMPAILQEAHKSKARIFLYGSTEDVLEKIKKRMRSDYPEAVVAGAISPPFRELTEEEIQDNIRRINESAPHLVMVALGCPRQEKWMAKHYQKIDAVLLGLGGAFPVTAGVQKRAPAWMQQLALEWLFRLVQEPRRMFKRYFYTNLLFTWLLGKELLWKPRVKEVSG